MTEKNMKKDVLGVKIDDINIDQALETVKGWLSRPGKHYIVTPNPEIVMMAQKDQELKNIINKADLAIADGVGLKLGGLLKRRTGDIVCHTCGVDLMEELIKLAADWGLTTGFLGGKDGVAKEAAECLLKKYPKLKVIFAESGGEVDNNGNVIARSDSDEAIFYGKERLPRHVPERYMARNDKGVDILFVAFGPPKQEKWIAKNLDKIAVKIAMGVGGSFDYLSGRVPRAPKWIRNFGFEWLFRLIREPWRIKRQLALVKFIFYMVK